MTDAVRLAAVLCLAASAAAAQSACPTGPADLERGVFMRFPDFTISLRRGPDGLLHEHEVAVNDQAGLLFRSRDGVFMQYTASTFQGQIEAGSGEIITYAGGIERIPPLFPEMNWIGTGTRRYEGDGAVEETALRLTAGPLETITIGGCTLNSFDVDFTNGTGATAFTDRLAYLPDLGASIYLGGGDEGAVIAETPPFAIEVRDVTIPGLSEAAAPVTPQPPPAGK